MEEAEEREDKLKREVDFWKRKYRRLLDRMPESERKRVEALEKMKEVVR